MTHERKRRPARGGADQLGGDRQQNSENTEQVQQDGASSLVIRKMRGAWCVVLQTPCPPDKPLRTPLYGFATLGEAVAKAQEISARMNWRVQHKGQAQ